jgi:hypothetical protein
MKPPVLTDAMRQKLAAFVPVIKQRIKDGSITPNEAMNYLPDGGGSGGGGGGVAQAAQALMTAGGGIGGIVLAVALVGGFLYFNSSGEAKSKKKT